MSRLSEFFNKMEPVNSESIKDNFDKLFAKYGFDGVWPEEIYVDMEGNITVDFLDVDDNSMRIIFAHEDEGSYALVATEEDNVLVFDLDPMRPVLRKTQTATYLDLTDSTWMTKSLLAALLTAGNPDGPSTTPVNKKEDEVAGYVAPIDGVTEGSRVVRGGKNIRMPVVREKKRNSLTHGQKENLVKSLMKRNERELSGSLRLTKD